MRMRWQLLLTLFATMIIGTVGHAAVPRLTVEAWREDLRVLSTELPRRHRDAFNRVSQATFETAVRDLDARIPSLEPHEVVVGFQQLGAMIGDGHTYVATNDVLPSFPVELYWFGNELRVTRAAPQYRRTVGARVVSIGGLDVAKVHDRLRGVIAQGENEWYVLQQSAQQATKGGVLAALGVTRRPTEALFEFEDEDGRFTLPLKVGGPESSSWIDAARTPPLYRSRPDDRFWFTMLPDRQTAYVAFRGYQNIEARSGELFDFLAAQQARRLVIDMRQNGGGNYTLVRRHLIEKLQFMPNLNRPGRLYIITGRRTFSAAMTNTTDFRRETEAIIVGEPTGARPNGFQEIVSFTLPHSKLRVGCSILRYRFQLGGGDAVMPDVRIDPNWPDYRAGRDPVLEWIAAQPIERADPATRPSS